MSEAHLTPEITFQAYRTDLDGCEACISVAISTGVAPGTREHWHALRQLQALIMAAPDLLEALEMVKRQIPGWPDDLGLNHVALDPDEQLQIQTAILKARGTL